MATEALVSVDRLLQDLSKRVARLQTSPAWQTQALQRFNDTCIRTVSRIREALAAANVHVDAAPSQDERANLQAKLALRSRELERLRGALQTALLACQKNAAQADTRQREELLGGATDNNEANQSEEIVTSLSRTRKMMSDQVARMAQVAQLVSEQDVLLRETADEHRGVGGAAGRAGRVLTIMRAKEAADNIIMGASTFLFFATAAYIVWSRVPGFGLF